MLELKNISKKFGDLQVEEKQPSFACWLVLKN